MDWDKLRIFHAAAEAGSFTHAGEQLHMSQSAVSRQISALEAALKVTLFHRHARGLVLTEQGELLNRTVSEVFAKLQTAETLLSDSTSKPSGDLRVTAPIGFGTIWLTPRLQEFGELYPDIRVELILNDEQVDIGMRAADAAIWTREPEQIDLIRRPLFESRLRAFASSQYLRKYGTPQSLTDLDSHRIIAYSGIPAVHLDTMAWIETAGRDGLGPREAALRVNSVVAIKYAIKAGIGIGMLPDYMTDQQSDLVPVLADIEQPSLNMVFAYPEELRNSKKVQLLRDFLISKIPRK
ncbi:LysR family transcriptional regulator [Hyphomicrobium methylovorum]|uniref:LysR family transcriptional regulator n=1 Tax=Hyphomicrobium methylovorum TaxID=84 RepID=UPI0015E7C01F|nr:LysR family transcriptional regulator [Hyphomicrobium methylovorum]MBA2126223.1 LysR family transcriptional regulator [Hyphomicrobium methylovorum]